MSLKQGDKAPFFSLMNQHQELISLDDFVGKKIIVFFYPKDNTPGCTKEACDLRDNYDVFLNLGYSILGVSCDGHDSHKKFISKYNLPFDLLCDTEQKMVKDYHVWGLKKFMGKEYMGLIRTTFIIDTNGLIQDIINNVKTKNHSEQILKIINNE